MRRILPQLIALSPPRRSLRSLPASAQLFFHQSSQSTATFCSPLSFSCHKYCTNHRGASKPVSHFWLPSVSPLTLVTSLARSARSMACLPFPLSFSLDSGRVSGVRCSRHSNCHWWMRCLSVGGADREWHGKQRPEKDPTESRRLDGHGK